MNYVILLSISSVLVGVDLPEKYNGTYKLDEKLTVTIGFGKDAWNSLDNKKLIDEIKSIVVEVKGGKVVKVIFGNESKSNDFGIVLVTEKQIVSVPQDNNGPISLVTWMDDNSFIMENGNVLRYVFSKVGKAPNQSLKGRM